MPSRDDERPEIPLHDVQHLGDLGRTSHGHEAAIAAGRDRLRALVAEGGPARLPKEPPATWRIGRSRYAVAGLGATAVVAGAASLLLTSGTPGREFPSAVAALAERVSDTTVVHTVETGDDVDALNGANGAKREMWAAVDGSIIRTRTTQPDGAVVDSRLERRNGEASLTLYRSKTNTLYRGLPHPSPAPETATGKVDVLDIASYREAVESGRARVDGKTTVNGRSAYRVVEDSPAGEQIWFVSTDRESPRLLRVQPPCRPASAPCPTTEYRVYELTDDRDSLELPPYPEAQTRTFESPAAK